MPERAISARPARRGKPSAASVAAGTVLAFDFGLKRVGVAVGERALGTAHPLASLEAGSKGCLEAIAALVSEWRPAHLVVGMPVAESGAHPLTARIDRFVRELVNRFGLEVTRVDERYSSLEAEDRLRAAGGARRAARASRARELDARSAQVILEQYFAESAR